MKKILFGILIAATLTGCMGRNALTQKATKFNLTTAESRWGREFLFIGMWIVPVYPITTLLDLFIFNSVEFWSDDNPINGQSPLLELPKEEVQKMGFNGVEKAQVQHIAGNKAKLYLDFENGDRATFDVFRDSEGCRVSYRGVEFYNQAMY